MIRVNICDEGIKLCPHHFSALPSSSQPSEEKKKQNYSNLFLYMLSISRKRELDQTFPWKSGHEQV